MRGTSVGMNIYSGSEEGNGLAAALTNPTALAQRKGRLQQGYPVRYRGVTYPDAEAAYQAQKRGQPRLSFEALQEIMIEVLVAKLIQYPRLVRAIRRQGGVAWLETCRHKVNGGRWEGVGTESAFLLCLMEAYRRVTSHGE